MKPKTGITLEEHKAFGEQLRKCRIDMMNLYIRVAQAYGKSKTVSRLARRASEAITPLQSEMEEMCCKDHPSAFHTDIYYGKPNA